MSFKKILSTRHIINEYIFEKNLNHLSYEDFAYNLNETPVAMEGDMPNILKNSAREISRTVMGIHYRKEGTLKNNKREEFLIYSLKDYYIVGNWGYASDSTEPNKISFHCVAYIELIPYKKFYQVKQVATQRTQQGSGIAYALYKFLIKEKKYELMSDEVQFFGARKLWKNLSLNGTVHVYDINQNKIILKNIKLKQGNLDHEIDTRVHSEITDFDNSKEHIRLILVDLKV